MSEPKGQSYEQMYTTTKAQFDELLEKNQNDLIKIKQREKQLKDRIIKLEQEKEQQKQQYEEQIKLLNQKPQPPKQPEVDPRQERLEELTLIVQTRQQRINELEASTRKLTDRNIELTADNSALKAKCQLIQGNLSHQITQQKQTIQLLQKQLQQQNAVPVVPAVKTSSCGVNTSQVLHGEGEFNKMASELVRFRQVQQNTQSVQSQLHEDCKLSRNKLHQAYEELKIFREKSSRANIQLRKKEDEIKRLKEEMEELRNINLKRHPAKSFAKPDLCTQCEETKQENQILVDMVNSSKTMIRVKEMEVSKLKLALSHTHPQNHSQSPRLNQSTSKNSDRFPPLKKK